MDITNFFQLVTPGPHMEGTYDIPLVLLSYLIATMASYVALDLADRIRKTEDGVVQFCWLIGGSLAMGMGVWTMHFVGMLAFMMPMTMYFDAFLTGLSMIIAIIASGFAFLVITRATVRPLALVLAAIFMGLGIASMHYTGMAAMLDVKIRYLPGLFTLSILVAFVASLAALALMIRSGTQKSYALLFKLFSALVMGFAICGMHYTGMAAAVIYETAAPVLDRHEIDPTNLSYSIVVSTIVIMIIALIASKLWGVVLEAKHKKLIDTEKKLVVAARSAGMAEVATTMLHNVGNVLNSINVSTQVLLSRNSNAQIKTLTELGSLIERNKNNLESFIQHHPSGKLLGNYLLELGKYLEEEQNYLHRELKGLESKVQHVKNIIATQQSLSKITTVTEKVDVNNLVDYALVINAIEKSGIKVIRNYDDISLVNVEKVKLLQILINLTKNAMEALLESNQKSKEISINTRMEGKDIVIVEVIDNGVGIEDLQSIFNYGFTTKKKGHGFGLHPSALSAREMGGSLNAFSEGANKGAKFVLTIGVAQPAGAEKEKVNG